MVKVNQKLPSEVYRLFNIVNRIRSDWAEAAPPGQTFSPRQQELWRQLHEAYDSILETYSG